MTPLRVGIVGSGVVGAAIAYELSGLPQLQVRVIDQRSPQNWQATGAALGVLIGAISPKLQGRHLQMRLESLRRYETLIPELESLTGRSLPYNRQGILELCFQDQDWQRWKQVAEVRADQGWNLEMLTPDQVASAWPEVGSAQAPKSGALLQGGVYANRDRQVDPIALTDALIEAAQGRGARFEFKQRVEHIQGGQSRGREIRLQTCSGQISVDWLIIAAGLGSTPLTQQLQSKVDIRPVLGQSLQLRRQTPQESLRPVIQAEDVHLIPLNAWELWVGATVEFEQNGEMTPDPEGLERLKQQAIALCPELKTAAVIRSWSGLRPRPEGRSAPIIEPLAGYDNILLATGHYRNGILLAPITALKIREWISSIL
jgi:glycine oxidase